MLGRMLLQCAPFASDPPLRFGVHTPDPGYQVRRQRGIVGDVPAPARELREVLEGRGQAYVLRVTLSFMLALAPGTG